MAHLPATSLWWKGRKRKNKKGTGGETGAFLMAYQESGVALLFTNSVS